MFVAAISFHSPSLCLDHRKNGMVGERAEILSWNESGDRRKAGKRMEWRINISERGAEKRKERVSTADPNFGLHSFKTVDTQL